MEFLLKQVCLPLFYTCMISTDVTILHTKTEKEHCDWLHRIMADLYLTLFCVCPTIKISNENSRRGDLIHSSIFV